jgi:hypothetical protein
MTEMKLYEISDELLKVIEAEEFDEAALNELVISFEKKAGGIVSFNESMQTFIDYCKSEEKRIAAKRKAVENRGKSLMSYLKMCMEAAEMMEMEVGTKTLKIQNNPPAVVIDDESLIDAKFFTVIPESKQLNKAEIKAALKQGEVTGAHTEQGTRLVVK